MDVDAGGHTTMLYNHDVESQLACMHVDVGNSQCGGAEVCGVIARRLCSLDAVKYLVVFTEAPLFLALHVVL